MKKILKKLILWAFSDVKEDIVHIDDKLNEVKHTYNDLLILAKEVIDTSKKLSDDCHELSVIHLKQINVLADANVLASDLINKYKDLSKTINDKSNIKK